MMILPVHEIQMLGVFDANTPNAERIVMVAQEEVLLSAYGVILTSQGTDGLYPLHDHFFWFGPAVAKKGSSIVLLTGSGTNRVIEDHTGTPRHLYYWSKTNTLFANGLIKPLLIHIGAMSAGNIVPTSYPQSPLHPLAVSGGMPKLSEILLLNKGMVKPE